jgi:hypothetical protein
VALALLTGGRIANSGTGIAASVNDADRCISEAAQSGASLQAHPTDHFVLLSSADGASAAATGVFLEQVRQQFYASFAGAGFLPRPSSDKLVCVCVDSYSQLDSYARLVDDVEASWMGGYYSHRTNRVAIVRFPGGARGMSNRISAQSAVSAAPSGSYSGSGSDGLNLRTVTHELAHQLAFNSGLQQRGVNYPFWVTEGLATNFEADESGAYGLSRSDAGYRSRLIQLKANGRLIPLSSFVRMMSLSSGQDQSARDAYAQAWGLFRYLFLHHRQELKEYISGWPKSRQSPERRFAEVFGPIEPLERDFQRSLGE